MARIPTFIVPQGDVRNVAVDYSATASDFGTSVASAAWTIDEGTSVTLSGSPSTSANVSTESVTAGANKTGCSLIKVTATMADSQTVSKYFKINVVDPRC